MTSKERFLTAMRNQVPDRVPVTPDFSNCIPCRRTGLPFWDVYYFGKVPFWRAYLDAADYFGLDAWVAASVGVPFTWEESRTETKTKVVRHPSEDAYVRKTTVRTPDGELTQEELCYRGDPPTPTVKFIKDFSRDWKKFKWTLVPPTGIDQNVLEEVRQECEKRGHAFGLSTGYPGLQKWQRSVHGGLEQLAYALMDYPEILDEWHELETNYTLRVMELLLSIKPDYLLFSGSGTITLASPDLAMTYAIPTLKKASQVAHEAGIPTMLHSCGKSRALIDMLCEHTHVNCVNPLEYPPMGDVVLAEAKKSRGRQIALMGNLHTTETMLRGTPEQVRERSKQAMRDAGLGGGFILSTGDQCGRDTPDENLFAMVETAKEFGQYDSKGNLPALL